MFKYRPIFKNVSPARYNVAAWKSDRTGRIMLLSRSVSVPGSHGEPDIGDLIQAEMTHNGKVLRHRTIWKPSKGRPTLEDPRALVYEKNKVLIGFTAVYKEGDLYVPYAGITHLDSTNWTRKLPKVSVYKNIGPGKNTTPVDKKTLFFRKDGPEYNHRLEVLTLEHKELSITNHLVFPKHLSWAQWRIGTTMPPVWLNEKEAIMVIHGISIVNGLYIYSLGLAWLEKQNGYRVTVYPEPLITPDDFVDSNNESLFPELHPELRRAVYACGGYLKSEKNVRTLVLLVNVGDSSTIAVQIPFDYLLSLFSNA